MYRNNDDEQRLSRINHYVRVRGRERERYVYLATNEDVLLFDRDAELNSRRARREDSIALRKDQMWMGEE